MGIPSHDNPRINTWHRRIQSLVIAVLTLAPTLVIADQTDDLVMALMAKGVLTEEEGTPLLRQKVTTPAKAKTEINAAYSDGIIWQTADQANMVGLNGRVQLDSRHYAGKDAQNTDTFDIRRAYITVRGKVSTYYDFNVTADLSQSGNQLDQAYFGVNWWSAAKLRVGQFDMPFGFEHLTSDLNLEFLERSFNDAFAPGKERGVMLHGSPVTGVYYGLAVSTGRGKNASNQDSQVDGVDTIARLTTNLAEVLGVQDTVYHLGVDYSKGDVSPNQATGSATLAAGGFTASSITTEAKGIKFFTPGKFSSALTDNPIDRTRYGLEAAYAKGPFKIQTEWTKQNYDGVNSSNVAFNKDMAAWYISTYWLLTGESVAGSYQQNGTWGRITPKHDFAPGKDGWGALGVSLRYSAFDADDFDSGSGSGAITAGAATTKATAWTAGVRWMLTSHAQLLADYVTTRFDQPLDIKNDAGAKIGATSRENAVTVRAQIDF